MKSNGQGALIIQSDLTVLLDERMPLAEQARELLLACADAVKRAGVIHTYRITPMTVWNALSSGVDIGRIVDGLARHARHEMPVKAAAALRLWAERYGSLKLVSRGGKLIVQGEERLLERLLERLSAQPAVRGWMKDGATAGERELLPAFRGAFKQELARQGYPVLDQAGYHEGEALNVRLKPKSAGGAAFALRDYQREAVDRFVRSGGVQGGSGVVVLPCGTGKTVVGIAALAELRTAALILTPNETSARQWRSELLDKTTLDEGQIGIYCGSRREVRPVTIATYNLMTRRRTDTDDYPHMKLFSERDWGLIVYDEVQLLPAPVFRMTATLQATRRLGLTATLVREDGCAEDVYSLIGPKLYDMNWRTAEEQQYISSVRCAEIRLPLHGAEAAKYESSGPRSKLRIAAENPSKLAVAEQLLERHKGKPALVIGQYLHQLNEAARRLNAPLLTGEVPQPERQRLYERFKSGEIGVIVVSKVANLAVDLPDAAVAIQLSGSFGSRQEEAQRIGRLLRPKRGSNEAWFYSLVTDGTKETEFALKRQMFMLEQGYRYELLRGAEGGSAAVRDEGAEVR